jgi:hypothetical protein
MLPVTGHRGVSRGAAATTLAWPWARAAPRETPRCPVSQESIASSHFASAPPHILPYLLWGYWFFLHGGSMSARSGLILRLRARPAPTCA